jgi:hypothetical protein
MNGLIYQGLEYSSTMALVHAAEKRQAHRIRLFDQIRLLEAGALSVINDRKDVPDNAPDSW